LGQHPVSHLEEIENLPTLSIQEDTGNRSWQFIGPGGRERSVRHRPRLGCGDLEVLREAAVQGVGIALLPEHVCKRQIQSGELIHLLPDWSTPSGSVQAVFTTRKGLRPSIRALIEFLAAEIPEGLERSRQTSTDAWPATLPVTQPADRRLEEK
jgi:DNA-binding transcriptional LysR family regulator